MIWPSALKPRAQGRNQIVLRFVARTKEDDFEWRLAAAVRYAWGPPPMQRSEHPGIKPSAKGFDNGDGSTYFVGGEPDLPADDRAGIVGLLYVVLVNHTHLLGQQVALLEHAARRLPFPSGKSIRKVKPKHLLHPAARR